MTPAAMSVLLVEDDDVVRASMGFALESSQIEVAEAGSVAEALRCFHDRRADVVVIDLHLPDGTGYDLARWLWRQHPQLPMVIISTDLDAVGEDLSGIPAHGRITLLAKPFSASELLDAICLVVADPAGGPR